MGGFVKPINEMKKYIGTKVVNATPMSRKAYNHFRGWEPPSDESGAKEGYLVEYIDGGEANTLQYKGFVCWYPKDVFERAYKLAETPLDRLLIEHKELQEKYNKLVLFLGREDALKIVGEDQFDFMELQKIQMKDYLTTLRLRIDLMKK